MADAPPVALRPLGTAEILDGAVRLLRRNMRGVLTISVPIAVVSSALYAFLQYATIDSKDATTIAALGQLMLGVTFGVVVAGLLTPLYGGDMLGEPVSPREALRQVGRSWWSLVALAVAVTVAESAGLAACLAGGIWMWGAWAVAAPALVLERHDMVEALRRSRNLVRGTFWRVWGIRALGWLLTSILALFVALPFDALALYIAGANPLDTHPTIAHPAWYVTILAVGGVVSRALLDPVAAAIDFLLYTDLRMRKEGMDIVAALPPEVAHAR